MRPRNPTFRWTPARGFPHRSVTSRDCFKRLSRTRSFLLALLIPLTGVVACDALAPGRSPGEKLYRKHCADCHGIDGKGQTVRFMGNTWANIVDDHWRYGGDPASLEHTLRTETVFQHPSFDDLSASDFKQIVKHVVKLRNP